MKKKINELRFVIEKREKSEKEKYNKFEYKRDLSLIDPDTENFRLKFKELRLKFSRRERK